MTRITAIFLLCAAPITQALAQYAALQVPKVISYQGRVTQNGAPWNPVTGDGYFVFALVQNGSVLWNNYDGNTNPTNPASVGLGVDQMLALPVSGGQFSVRLGTTGNSGKSREIPATVFFDASSNSVRGQVKLAVWFSADANTFHRLGEVPDNPATTMINEHQLNDIDLASVPYSLVAGIAETVQDRAISNAKLTSGSVASEQITNGTIVTVDLQDSAVTSQKIEDGTLQAADFSTTLQADSVIPPGSIMPYGGITAPPGWLMCDGTPVLRATYIRLHDVVKEYFGNGTKYADGSTRGTDALYFNLPDFRGRFLRGVDGTNSRDPDRHVRTAMNAGGLAGNNIGSLQADRLRTHNHRWADSTNGDLYTRTLRSWTSPVGDFRNVLNPYVAGTAGGGGDDDAFEVAPNASSFYTDPSSTVERADASETRPINTYVNYIIKY